MSKASLKKATEFYVSIWNEHSNSYMDLEGATEEIFENKEGKDRETIEMLEERIIKLERLKNSLFDKWIAANDNSEVPIYKHYRRVCDALKAANYKMSRRTHISTMFGPENESIEENYAG